MELILYFSIGLIHDALTAFWYLALESRKMHLAGFLSGFVTFLGYGVICYLALSPEFMYKLITYCAGCWAGTYIAVYIKEYFNKKIL